MYLQQLLTKVSAEPSIVNLPAVLRVPLSQPQFLLGAVFVIFVLFVPGGLAGLAGRRRTKSETSPVARDVVRIAEEGKGVTVIVTSPTRERDLGHDQSAEMEAADDVA